MGGNGGKLQPTAPSQACSRERSKDLGRECQTLKLRKDGEIRGVRYPTRAFLAHGDEFVQSVHRKRPELQLKATRRSGACHQTYLITSTEKYLFKGLSSVSEMDVI